MLAAWCSADRLTRNRQWNMQLAQRRPTTLTGIPAVASSWNRCTSFVTKCAVLFAAAAQVACRNVPAEISWNFAVASFDGFLSGWYCRESLHATSVCAGHALVHDNMAERLLSSWHDAYDRGLFSRCALSYKQLQGNAFYLLLVLASTSDTFSLLWELHAVLHCPVSCSSCHWWRHSFLSTAAAD